MATKREIMAVGTAAPLARMLGSDSPHVVQPGGANQATATPLETNFVVLSGGAGGGVRLPPASAQYLHFLFNSTVYTVEVYPDDDEQINNQRPGEPFLLEAWMSGIFAPARTRWIAGGLPGAAAAVPSSIPGPFGVGVVPPADASPVLFVHYEVCLQAYGRTTAVAFNCYDNGTDDIYLADGPAFLLQGGAGGEQILRLLFAPAGTAGARIQWHQIARFSGLSGGPSGAVSALTDLGLNWQYVSGGDSVYIADGPAAAMSFDTAVEPVGAMTLWVSPPGVAGEVIPNWWDVAAFQHPSQLVNSQTTLSLLWRDSAGAVRTTPVTVGAPNSGGTGFRQLLVPN